MDEAIVVVAVGHAGGRTALRRRAQGRAGSEVPVGDEPERPYRPPPLSRGPLPGEPFAVDRAIDGVRLD